MFQKCHQAYDHFEMRKYILALYQITHSNETGVAGLQTILSINILILNEVF